MSDYLDKRKELMTSLGKEAIYQAATQVLLEHGQKGMTVSRVAQAANMANGTLYNYFKDKESLILYICLQLSEPLNLRCLAIQQSSLPAIEKLEKIIQAAFELLEERRPILMALTEGKLHRMKDYEDQIRQSEEYAGETTGKSSLTQAILHCLKEGMANGSMRIYDPRMITDIIFGALMGLIEGQQERDCPASISENLQNMMEIILDGIRR